MTIAWGLMAVAGLWAGSACAQEVTDAQDAERPARDDIIITAARTNLPASALPLTVDVIDRETLSRQVAVSG